MPGGSGRIDAPNVNAYVVGSSGGGSVDAAPAAKPAKAETVESSGSFDPGEHTVAEVQEYLEAHPDEEAKVLRAEKAGKNRATLVGD